jgi:subtilisin-like proprotein convertase family protein
MKKLLTPLVLSLLLILISHGIHAQVPPKVIWSFFYPNVYQTGNYTANDVKESPYGGFVLTGSRKIQAANGYSEVIVMRVDDEGYEVSMNEIFGGVNSEGIPWDQEAWDMIITPAPYISYLVTGYRDTTLTSGETPPGLFLTEVWGNGSVLFDSLYFNNNLHRITGRCIQPAIEGGYIIACDFREDGGGTSQTMLTRMVKTEEGKYVTADVPAYRTIPVGLSGYATWIRQFGDGYLIGGTAFTSPNTKDDLFIQKLDADRNLEWTKYYGWEDSDFFSDALIYGDTVYMAGSAKVIPPGMMDYKDQIYVSKIRATGEVDWERTYGGIYRHFANKIMMTGEGDLLVAGSYYDAAMHAQMILMKIDAETGDSLWTQEYGDFYSSGFRDVIRTEDFGYLTVGRANYSGTQDPRVFVMKLDHGNETLHLMLPRESLGLNIIPGVPTTDAINFTTEVDTIYGVSVVIDSLLHPSVGDLEVSLTHNGTTVTLADRPVHSGENFIQTGFMDVAYRNLDWDYAPYTGWYLPEDPLSVFMPPPAEGDWTLTVMDHGSGGTKATTGVLEGWSLNFLVDAGSGTGIPPEERMAGFGLEPIRPNPFSQEAMVGFRIVEPGPVKLTVYNQLGQLVEVLADEELPEGVHELMWQPGHLAPGTYIIRLESGGMISVRKALLTR